MEYLRLIKSFLFSCVNIFWNKWIRGHRSIHFDKAYAYTHYKKEIVSKDCKRFLEQRVRETSKPYIKFNLTELFRHPDKCSLFALIVQYTFASKKYIQVFYSDCTAHDIVYVPTSLSQLTLTNCFKHHIKRAYAWTSPHIHDDITDLVKQMAGPKGDFFTTFKTTYGVYVKHVLNKHRNFAGLMIVDNKNMHYFYELKKEKVIRWPDDGINHMMWTQHIEKLVV